nr:palmitoyl-protein thioesterase 1-like [Ipomoea trifida]
MFTSIPLSHSIPFVILHGLGMQCNDEGSIFYQSSLSMLTGVKGTCLEIGNGAYDSWIMPMEQQVHIACEKVVFGLSFFPLSFWFIGFSLRSMPELQQGYNLVGLSQGNVIARGVIELCDNAPPTGPWCAAVGFYDEMGVYSDYVQARLGPSGYTRLPNDIPGYLRGCRFLPTINNEIPSANNAIHKQRFTSLQNLVLIMFESDGVVNPPLSSWFGFYQDGDSSRILPPQQTRLYKEDLFGLRTLDEAGKVKFIKVPGVHLVITIPQLQQYVVPYLVDSAAGFFLP